MFKIAPFCFIKFVAVIICMFIHLDVFAFGFGIWVYILRDVIPYRDYSMNLHGTTRMYNESINGC